jgi:hypothetical protein
MARLAEEMVEGGGGEAAEAVGEVLDVMLGVALGGESVGDALECGDAVAVGS